MNMACFPVPNYILLKQAVIVNRGQMVSHLEFLFCCKYLQSQYIKGPKSIKTSKDVPKCPSFNKIRFSCASRFSSRALSSLERDFCYARTGKLTTKSSGNGSECKSTCAKSRVDLKKSPSSRIGQPREKQSDDLKICKFKSESS